MTIVNTISCSLHCVTTDYKVGNFCGVQISIDFVSWKISKFYMHIEYIPWKYKPTKLSKLSKPWKFKPSKITSWMIPGAHRVLQMSSLWYMVIFKGCKFLGICSDFTVCEIFILKVFHSQDPFYRYSKLQK